MPITHRYPIRGVTKINESIEELATRVSSKQVKTSTSNQHSSQSMTISPDLDDHTINHESDDNLIMNQPPMEQKIFVAHQSKSPQRISSEHGTLLEEEVNFLKAELNNLKLQHSQSQSDAMNLSSGQTFSQHPVTTTFQQPSFTSPFTPPIQVVVKPDPLQQIKDFIKSFAGNDNEDVRKWVESISHVFDIICLPGANEELCLQYAPAFLKGYGYKWWIENKAHIQNWSTFKQLIIERFGEKNEYLLEQQLNHRKQQPNEPTIQYYYDILELCAKCDPDMSDRQRIRKLMNGLRLSLYQEAIKDTYATPSEFLTKVQRLEKIEKLMELRQTSMEMSGSWATSNNRSDASTTYPTVIPNDLSLNQNSSWHYTTRNQSSSPHVYPNRQTSRDHQNVELSRPHQLDRQQNSDQYRTNASTPRQNTSMGGSNFQCYYCGQWGHYARNCWQRNNSSSSQQPSIHQKNQ